MEGMLEITIERVTVKKIVLLQIQTERIRIVTNTIKIDSQEINIEAIQLLSMKFNLDRQDIIL